MQIFNRLAFAQHGVHIEEQQCTDVTCLGAVLSARQIPRANVQAGTGELKRALDSSIAVCVQDFEAFGLCESAERAVPLPECKKNISMTAWSSLP
ncbi:hypothetical protein L596_000098 [Steinernema carpocapsae]|uniref:Uncharacterized protein n=1 Tax=Steinernema carpocapsae TaxID=34508 RepID=A0A4U8UI62_STECR|nr:hypothetical protein L596_000098 [Steinernema carpocapsae]